jgi:hypothetical protein
MEIKRSGSRPSRKGPAENFTGSVRIDPLFDPPDPARAYGALVTFEPGARTAWHTHPLGQTLIVTSGCGWTLCWSERKKEIRPARDDRGAHWAGRAYGSRRRTFLLRNTATAEETPGTDHSQMHQFAVSNLRCLHKPSRPDWRFVRHLAVGAIVGVSSP